MPGPGAEKWCGCTAAWWPLCHYSMVKLAGPEPGPKAACWEVTPVSEPLAHPTSHSTEDTGMGK